MTTTTAFVSLMFVITLLPTQRPALLQKSTPNQPANTTVIADFTKRVQQYHDLRDKVDEGAARQTQTKDPEKLVAEKKVLADRVIAARAGAKPGDIFTPAVQPVLKQLLKPALKGPDGTENKNMITEEKPAVALKVNAPYPESQPLAAVPPDVLKQLPPLPKDIEYRFVKKTLLLFDSRANLIIDVLPNAIP